MFGFAKSFRAARPVRGLRFKLGLEELGLRITPSGTDDSPPPTPPAGIVNPPPAPVAPVIDAFDAIEVGHGLYKIVGHVTAAAPNGMVVSFAGVPSLAGKSAVCDANGNFTLVFPVQTNGTDRGTISARTVDSNGLLSDFAYDYMNPTP